MHRGHDHTTQSRSSQGVTNLNASPCNATLSTLQCCIGRPPCNTTHQLGSYHEALTASQDCLRLPLSVAADQSLSSMPTCWHSFISILVICCCSLRNCFKSLSMSRRSPSRWLCGRCRSPTTGAVTSGASALSVRRRSSSEKCRAIGYVAYPNTENTAAVWAAVVTMCSHCGSGGGGGGGYPENPPGLLLDLAATPL